jgi:hypothetical protein
VFLTLGIYYFVWYYKANRELRDLGRAVGEEDRLGRSPLTSLMAHLIGWVVIVPPFVSMYRTFRRIEAAQEVSGTSQRVSPWLGFVLYLIGVILLRSRSFTRRASRTASGARKPIWAHRQAPGRRRLAP